MSQVMVQEKPKHMFSPLAEGKELEPDQFPALYNISAAHLFQFLPHPVAPKPPEFVYVDHDPTLAGPERDWEGFMGIAQWNVAYESADLRYQIFRKKIPKRWGWLEKFNDQNVYLLPRGAEHTYQAYSPLFHLLPRATLERFGLPLLKKGGWPYTSTWASDQEHIPADFRVRLGAAFAQHVWPLIDSGSKLSAFSQSDSLKLLAHNLDFWLPYAYQVAEERLKVYGRVKCESTEQAQLLKKIQGKMPPDARTERPRKGGAVWWGEEDAWLATQELLHAADAQGRLRGIVDAIRSNRVEDDFSNRWSYAREDFERKLFKKRRKVQIRFVELDDTVPVHGPDSEVEENLLFEDLMGLCDVKERKVIVLLRKGTTKLGDISKELGYANHSPISKALARIRAKAERMLE